jgi:hypothetical protein
MSAQGQSRHFGGVPVTSGLPPNSGHVAAPQLLTLCATSGSDAFLFDHLIGPDEQRRRHGNSDRASGVQVYGQFDPCWFLKW